MELRSIIIYCYDMTLLQLFVDGENEGRGEI